MPVAIAAPAPPSTVSPTTTGWSAVSTAGTGRSPRSASRIVLAAPGGMATSGSLVAPVARSTSAAGSSAAVTGSVPGLNTVTNCSASTSGSGTTQRRAVTVDPRVPASPVVDDTGAHDASSSATTGIRRPSTARAVATTAKSVSSGTRVVTSTVATP